MREILFRGKRLDNSEWEEGYLVKTNRNTFIMYPNQFNDDLFLAPGNIFVSVDPSTVGQYTGLTDKNSKRIFEGDVVTFTRENAIGYMTRRCGDVRYYEELPIFYIMASTGDAWDWCYCEDVEVIGNIHDNPELLKDGE